MRLTKENIDKYLDKDGDLDLYNNKEITHIDYIHDNLKYINIGYSNVEEITCKLPEGLELLRCFNSKLTSLPLLPKTLYNFDGEKSKLPEEYCVYIVDDNIQCNRLRNLQLLELI